jgi:FAD/FMN-containing dehydrogenase
MRKLDIQERPTSFSATRLGKQHKMGVAPSSRVDEGALLDELRCQIRGEVRFEAGSRALYSTDASNYRQIPIGVVVPRDGDDIIRTIEACRRHGAPVLARGGGTSLAGQCCNVAVVIDCSKYLNRVVALDAERKSARVELGLILDNLRNAAERYNLTYGPDPATHSRCTLGGMIGNNSCGVHSLIAGMTDENVEDMEVLTYDGLRMRVGKTSASELERIVQDGGRLGEIYAKLDALRSKYADQIRKRYPNIPRRVSGYNLPALLPENEFNVARALVGSEGTCVTVLEATVRLVYSPPARALVVLGYPDIYAARDQIPELLESRPIGLEGFDEHLIDDMRKKNLLPGDVALLPEAKGWLLVEFGGARQVEAAEQARRFIEREKAQAGAPRANLFTDQAGQARVWKVREAALGATAKTPDLAAEPCVPVLW